MVWFWRYLFGFLSIKFEGENAVQVLNAATKNNIHIWNLKSKKGIITGNISIKNFYKLRFAKRGIKCKIYITEKRGIIFKKQKYINRLGFFIGFILFILTIYILSSFVWIININGNTSISSNEILSSCKSIGIFEGVPVKQINSKYDAERILLLQKKLAWCSINVEGSVLTINVTESINTDKEERSIPTNLKAKSDGIIKKINVTSGDVNVKVGDIVSKGDLLVSGVMKNMYSTLFVHSSGEIIAETKRVFSSEGKYTQLIQKNTNKKITHYTINFFNFKIPLYLNNVNDTNLYKQEINDITLFDKKIPLKIAYEEYNITESKKITYDRNALEKILYNEIKKQVADFNFINAVETEREVITTDKGILLKIVYTCEENIAFEDKILLSKEN